MLANRRCVIPAEGFYEWREEDGLKEPYFFARKDGRRRLLTSNLTCLKNALLTEAGAACGESHAWGP